MSDAVEQTEHVRIAWSALQGHYQAHGRPLDLRQAFADDPQRFERFSLQAPEVFADLSKQRWDAQALRLLLELAQAAGVVARRDAMFSGEAINTTEGRAVLHTALRASADATPRGTAVHEQLERMLAFAETVRSGGAFDDVLHLGIGGSDLGPAMAAQALAGHAQGTPRVHYVSNVDPQALAVLLPALNPQRTLVTIASKTFTTQETMTNAEVVRAWLAHHGVADPQAQMVGLTAQPQKARASGVAQTFEFWDWVGGRFSLWSAIGLPLAIAIGAPQFRALLAGARAMDEHFLQAPMTANLPLLLGLLDVWNVNFHGFATRCVVPYAQALARLPAYLQQLEMESNGKSVDLAGEPLRRATCPVVWGEPGTNAQHAFFQMLHQGTQVVPVEFIAVRQPDVSVQAQPESIRAQMQAQHRILLANCLAQSQALMHGRTSAQAAQEQAPTAAAELTSDVLARHRACSGNRPSTTLFLERLTPRSLGALIALYEHRVLVAGTIWGINSFDQWGVELGKALCRSLLPAFAGEAVSGLDGSTAGLVAHLLNKNDTAAHHKAAH